MHLDVSRSVNVSFAFPNNSKFMHICFCISLSPMTNAGEDAGWNLQETGKEREKSWRRTDLNVVLVHPQIPQNTGNVSRTCAATGVGLHLVGPLGFKIDDKLLKRAGLDYWEYVCVNVRRCLQFFLGAAFQTY